MSGEKQTNPLQNKQAYIDTMKGAYAIEHLEDTIYSDIFSKMFDGIQLSDSERDVLKTLDEKWESKKPAASEEQALSEDEKAAMEHERLAEIAAIQASLRASNRKYFQENAIPSAQKPTDANIPPFLNTGPTPAQPRNKINVYQKFLRKILGIKN